MDFQQVRRQLSAVASKARRLYLRPHYRASFYKKLDYRVVYWNRLVALKGIEDALYPELTKLQSRAQAIECGIDVPQLYAGPVDVEELDLASYGSDFVIKPDWGASSVGVLVLKRTGADKYVDAISGEVFDERKVREFYKETLAAGRRGRADQLVVEQSLAAGSYRPTEWKVFAFHGRVGLVQQMDRNGKKTAIKIYDAQGKDVGRIRRDHIFDPTLPKSIYFDQLVEAAEAISASIPTGFVRVDFFEVPEGIILGELSLIPGGDLFFKDGWDQRLGKMWDKANIEILATGSPLIP